QAVDINTIPSDLIERVDVMTGGASAIYGADGVTGVVNFVMKKDFEGLSARLQSGISGRGDAARQLFALTAGRNFLDGGANFALAYEYGRENPLYTRDRPGRAGSNAVQFVPNPADPAVVAGTG